MGTFDKYLQLADKTYFNRLGKVTKIVGLTIARQYSGGFV